MARDPAYSNPLGAPESGVNFGRSKTQDPPPNSSPPLKPPPTVPDPSRLAPEHAAYTGLELPKRMRQRSPLGLANEDVGMANGSSSTLGDGAALRGMSAGGGRKRRERDKERDKERARSASRRRKGGKGPWKKLLWVKQSYPDNYTDEDTFLDHLQRNPRLQPYEFWPLAADATVIVQHIGSVLVFIGCFVAIYQERVSPVAVVGTGSAATVLGWALWDRWVGQQQQREEEEAAQAEQQREYSGGGEGGEEAEEEQQQQQQQQQQQPVSEAAEQRSTSAGSAAARSGKQSGVRMSCVPLTPTTGTGYATGASSFANHSYYPPYGGTSSSISPRNQQRLATAKSAVLIYSALLGLSPILRSLTKSTTSDSIWAMSTWLMFINVFFFDYGGGVGAKFPASLSTNAAIMASTVLASRLPSTTHVFSLTLFSIEVFGLFPVFRRHLRHISWRGHLALTLALVIGQGAGMALIFPGAGWAAAIAGIIISLLLTSLAMGISAWWLIGLQKYKNEIHGPWDPARPILRRHWD
ncbi:MAG: hypothetical protein M1821_007795 [Bathelium mastoideum]|nr:MAG: hypothetical protein M1821_007795 [Bathelium mastoideum]